MALQMKRHIDKLSCKRQVHIDPYKTLADACRSELNKKKNAFLIQCLLIPKHDIISSGNRVMCWYGKVDKDTVSNVTNPDLMCGDSYGVDGIDFWELTPEMATDHARLSVIVALEDGLKALKQWEKESKSKA